MFIVCRLYYPFFHIHDMGGSTKATPLGVTERVQNAQKVFKLPINLSTYPYLHIYDLGGATETILKGIVNVNAKHSICSQTDTVSNHRYICMS